jgi:hypothetical protein
MSQQRKIVYPLQQVYDGNNPTVNHLFEKDSKKALCGRKKSDMEEPVNERTYSLEQAENMSFVIHEMHMNCKRCYNITLKNLGAGTQKKE